MSSSPSGRLLVRIVLLMLVVPLVVARAEPARAHPADEILERDLVHVHADAMQIDLTISAGAITLLTVWKAADTNGDDALDAAEGEAFGAALADGFGVKIDGGNAHVQYVPGSLHMADSARAFALQGGDAGGATVSAAFTMPFDASTAREVTVAVHHFRAADGAKPPDLIPNADVPLGIIVQGGTDVALRMTIAAQSAITSLPPPATVATPNDRTVTIMQRFVREGAGNPFYLLLGLLVAAALGALHALTPGHGKTLITAYLVGTEGRPRDAFALGGIITVTHTGSVVALGVATLLVARLWTPYRLLPWIECGTSAAIIIVGIWLAWTRFAAVVSLKRSRTRGRRAAQSRPSRADDAMHEHEDGTVHSHGFGSHRHMHPGSAPHSLREIAVVGISGGILPCPDALAILLVAVAAGNIVAGLSIIFAFSAGLAAVLIGLGLLITGTRVVGRITDRASGRLAATRWIPACSAVIMVAVGVAAFGRAVAAII
ncbi:MAG: nickel/cobalt transporter [Thermomicrobiales bacterium]